MSAQKKPINALQAVLDRQTTAKTTDLEHKPVVQPAQLRSKRQPKKNAPEPIDEGSTYSRPSRTGKRLIGGHFSPDVAKHLKILAAEEDTSVQSLLEEALDLLFVKKGRGHIKRV
jgi:hypothetical protein